mgnify:CR=1 FL=1
MPEGFAYREDLLTRAEEADLVRRFESLPFKPFEFHGYLGKRRIVSFGWRYDYSKRGINPGAAIPDWLVPLRDLFGLCMWLGGFFGSSVVWRGTRYRLDPGGRLAGRQAPAVARASAPAP